MRKIVMQKMVKIVAVSMMSVLVSISFNGCGFFSSSTGKIEAESCSGEGVVTIREQVEKNGKYVNTMAKGECKNGVKEGLWKYYSANDSSELIQEVTFANGIRNGITKKDAKMVYDTYISRGEVRDYETREYYVNGKKVGEIKGAWYRFNSKLHLYEDDIKTASATIRRVRTYSLPALAAEYERKVEAIKEQNKQIEYENNQMQWEANAKYKEIKAKAQEIAKQRAESKVKKPTMQEVKNSKNVMETYRAKLQAQVEKELQIELSKIQAPQVIQKQTQAIPPYKEPKLDTYEEFLALTKDKKYTIAEFIKNYSFESFEIVSEQDSNGSNFKSEIKYGYGKYRCNITNNTYRGNGCLDLKSKDSFKETIENSIFKDKFNAILS